MVPDQSGALEALINLGFDRILTSGGKPDVVKGASRLKDLVDQVFKNNYKFKMSFLKWLWGEILHLFSWFH